MNDEKSFSIALTENKLFGELIHSLGQKGPLALGFGSCCCSCSSSAAVFTTENSVN